MCAMDYIYIYIFNFKSVTSDAGMNAAVRGVSPSYRLYSVSTVGLKYYINEIM